MPIGNMSDFPLNVDWNGTGRDPPGLPRQQRQDPGEETRPMKNAWSWNPPWLVNQLGIPVAAPPDLMGSDGKWMNWGDARGECQAASFEAWLNGCRNVQTMLRYINDTIFLSYVC